jgi:hypothetical protein
MHFLPFSLPSTLILGDDDVDRLQMKQREGDEHFLRLLPLSKQSPDTECFFDYVCFLSKCIQRLQVIKMLLLVIALFLICWGPRLIFNVVVKLELQSYTTTTYTVRVASYLLSFIHSALNPFVYGLMSSTFRNIIFKSCAGRNRTREPDSCAASGRIVVGSGSKLASGTWAGDEIIDDDEASGVRVSAVTAGRRRLLGIPHASSPTPDVRMCNLSRHSRDFDPRERSFSQATVLSVAPMDVS